MSNTYWCTVYIFESWKVTITYESIKFASSNCPVRLFIIISITFIGKRSLIYIYSSIVNYSSI